MSEVSLFNKANFCLLPLSDDSVIASLKELLHFIETTSGPKANLKIVQNMEGGHATLSSSSQRLFPVIPIQNVFSRIIVSSANTQNKAFGDNGLTCALVTLKFVTFPNFNISLSLAGLLIEHFGKLYLHCLKECSLCLDISDLSSLQSLARSIILSKPGILPSCNSKEWLVSLLLKTFLGVIPKGIIRIMTSDGMNPAQSQVFNGLLIPVLETDLKGLTEGQKKAALFTNSLPGTSDLPFKDLKIQSDFECDNLLHEDDLSKLFALDVVFCQKIVLPSLKKKLQDGGIQVYERLGTVNANFIQKVSSVVANSSLFSKVSFFSLDAISKERIGNKTYLLLKNDSAPCQTLVICDYNEEALQELNVVCEQVLSALLRILKSPKVCFGGGCSELRAAHLLRKRVGADEYDVALETNCTPGQLNSVLQAFIHCISGRSRLQFVTDSKFGHLWKSNDGISPCKGSYCECGSYSTSNITSWLPLSETGSLHLAAEEERKCLRNVILDELSCRVNSLALAFETASLLLRTSVCVSNLPQPTDIQ